MQVCAMDMDWVDKVKWKMQKQTLPRESGEASELYL